MCVFLINGKKKNTGNSPLSLFSVPPQSFRDPPSHSYFFSVLFCYESTSLFVILGSPGFLFSVKFPYAKKKKKEKKERKKERKWEVKIGKNVIKGPGWVIQLVEDSSPAPKGCEFAPPVGARTESKR